MPANIFLPILTVARELDARLMLGARLCRDGHTVYLGLTRTLDAAARMMERCIYLQPILNAGPAARVREMKALGHWIVGWDEEGVVYPNAAWYRTDRVSAEILKLLDMLVLWGPQQRIDLQPLLVECDARVVTAGNPRADMLRAPYRSVVDRAAAAIREKRGPFVLINTNFDLVNHLDGAARFQQRLRSHGYFAGEAGAGRLQRWADYRRFMYATFLAGIPGFLDRLAGRHVILRPHPSEDPAPWYELARRYSSLRIELPRGSVLPWLAAAEVLIHNSCTTAVEAFALGTPIIAIHPPGLDGLAESALPNALSHKVPDWIEAACAVRDGPPAATALQRGLLRRHVAGFPAQDCIESLARLLNGAARSRAPAERPRADLFARDDIGMIAQLPDSRARFPPFCDGVMQHARDVLASSPHGAPQLHRIHDYALALTHAAEGAART